eukprot:TRINITY_DN12724_c0_g1_i1.p1 TRINITY_DN12724_c0_g1~~TRINITY_DN12724_c0_g1_i1.p1  ORF type:complete len:1088 (+),score=329.81 TRINITY_DN12724_c0_g1_i1:47-3310(+)
MLKMFGKIGKTVQRHVFTLLGTRWGLGLLLLCSFVTLNSVLHAAERILQTSIVCPRPSSERDFNGNIGGRSYENFLCHEPIDVVYTWVNGSDPWMQRNLQYYKFEELLAEQNISFDETKTSASRFQDNQEIRYSLRSLVRNAGWVRHVYLVTNGQIPSWLNIDHPKLTIIPHHQIFRNVSHLPVFASPSIECHLHRIPGLSRRFIYMNDDVFFGRPIHPEDFYSNVDGHRIYLSWPVPNCAEGCPGTWVGDGYCDRPCNCTECDFDGGDCVGKNAAKTTHNVPATSYVPTTTRLDQCSQGCPDNWLADKFCDRNCNNPECGYDAVDCAIEDVMTLMTVHITQDSRWHSVPAGVRAISVNLTAIFGEDDTITSGDFESEGDTIRLTSVSQKNKIMVVLIREDQPRILATFSLSGLQADTKEPLFVTFNITLGGTVPETNATSTAILPNSTLVDSSDDGSDVVASAYNRRLLQVRIAEGTNAYDAVSTGVRYSDEQPTDAAERSARLLQEPSDARLNRRVWNAKRSILKRKILEREQLEDDTKDHWRSVENQWKAQYGDVLSKEELREAAWSTRRKLLDTFGDSLKYVNKLMNAKFGNQARKVPSHMAHFIDSQVVREMHDQWSEEFEQTSANRFRSPSDMQYSFTHMYWITHARTARNSFNYFVKNLDLNGNGVIDPTEYRRVAVLLWEGKVTAEQMRAVLEAPELAPEEPTTGDEGWRFPHLNESVVARWRANLTGESFNPVNENVVEASLLETCAELGTDNDDEDQKEQERTATVMELVMENTTHATPTLTALANAPLVCKNQTVEVMVNGTIVYKEREVCERVVEVPADEPPVEPPVYVWKPAPPAEDNEPCMLQDYFDLVVQLIELAAAGIGETRYIRPSLTGLMTAYHFNDSHLAGLLQRGDEEQRYKHIVMTEDEVSFFMIRNNATVVQRQMDHMMWKRARFMCINDNMNHSDPANREVLNVLLTFMKDYFPIATEFELPDGVENKHLHTFEYSPEEQARYGWYTPEGLDPFFAASMRGSGESSVIGDYVKAVKIFYLRNDSWILFFGGLVALFACWQAVLWVLGVFFRRAPPPLPSGLLGR